jgi:hypothetical protein
MKPIVRWLLLPACLFVVAGVLVAPRHRSLTAIVLYAIGAWVAWVVLRGWYFPESHPRVYQQSKIPLVLTLVGGFAAAVAVIAFDQVNRRSTEVPRSELPCR